METPNNTSDKTSKKVFITSALPYVNNVPHLGNVVGSVLGGDILSRYNKLIGNDVIYLCGTDEYGSTTTFKAMQEGITCKQLCDKYNLIHKKVYDWFNIEFDVWGRTTTEAQTKLTHEIFEGLYKNGFIEEKTLKQMYCNKCKLFLADRYLKGICYHDECKGKIIITNGDQCDTCQKPIEILQLIDPFCSICKGTPELKDTDHLFLKLDVLSENISKYLEQSKFKKNVLGIAQSWFKMGLQSRCITRDLEWGTKIPILNDSLKKYENKVFYVWFDAPIGYYSILANQKDDWRKWLCDPNLQWIATQAKDNVPFHTIIFPGTMLGSGVNLPLITDICATDYLLYCGQKFSKSNNIGVFGDQVIEISKRIGFTEDDFRYYLTKIRPETSDSSFSWNEFVTVIDSDLVNNIGNFINRCVTLTKKLCDNKFNGLIYDTDVEKYVISYHDAMKNFKLREALTIGLELSSFGNKFLQDNKPWNMKKTIIDQRQNIADELSNLLKDKINKINEKIETIGKKQDNNDIDKQINSLNEQINILDKNIISIDEQLNKIDDTIKNIMEKSNFICITVIKMLTPFIPRTCERILTQNIISCDNYLKFSETFELPFKKFKYDDVKKILCDLDIYC